MVACTQALKRLDIDFEVVDYVEIDKYAVMSYNAMNNTNFEPQDISEWDKDVEVDLVMHGSPCFVGDTLVLTDRGYTQIKDVQIGDSVLSHDNKWHKVTNVIPQGSKHIWNVRAMGLHELRTTYNHKFYVRKKYFEWDNDKKVYGRRFTEPKWMECGELTTNHYLGYAINTIEKPIEWEGVECVRGDRTYTSNKLPINDETFWYIVGRYLGDGWTRNRPERNNSLSITIICCGKHKKDQMISKMQKQMSATIETNGGGTKGVVVKDIDTDRYRIRKITPREAWRLMDLEIKSSIKLLNVVVTHNCISKQVTQLS